MNNRRMLEQQKALLEQQQVDFEHQLFPNAGTQKPSAKQSPQHQPQRKQEARRQLEPRQRQHDSLADPKRTRGNKRQRRAPPADRERSDVSYLYNTQQSHPVIEYLPSQADTDSGSLTPSFVLEVTWPRVVQFYHPDSPRCHAWRPAYVALARGLRGRSSRLPVEFHAVSCAAHRQVCEDGFRVARVPLLVVLRSGSIEWTEVALPGGDTDGPGDAKAGVEDLAQALGIPLDVATGARPRVGDGGAAARGAGNERPGEASAEAPIPLADQVFYDAKSSFLATLTSSLYSQLPPGSALPPDTTRALGEMLDLIRWAFPPETPLHDLAEELKLEYASVSAGEEGLLRVVRRHAPAGRGVAWSPRCRAEASGGYACGLWTLLHVLSVGVAERHASVIGDADRVSVIYAGRVVRSFVARFFAGCPACRDLWTELYDAASANDGGGGAWGSLALWTWEVHNEITLHRQRAAGRGYYQPQSRLASSSSLWPPKEECPHCWTSLTDDTGLVTNMDSYDREEVYRHLKHTYWPGGVQNNRLIVLGRWSKAKRALSIQRLRARMAARHWGISVLLVQLLVAWIIVRTAFPRWSLSVVIGRLRRGRLRRDAAQKWKRRPQAADRSPLDRRTRPCDASGGTSSPYGRHASSSRSRPRQSVQGPQGYVPGGSRSGARANAGRRQRAGASGSRRSETHRCHHFLEL